MTAACGGLPRTDTLPAGTPSGGGVLGVLMLALAAMAGAALVLRRTN